VTSAYAGGFKIRPMNILMKPLKMDKLRDYVLGFFLSAITWEAWQNMIISLIVALVGGFMAAAGRQLHKTIYEWKHRKKHKPPENEI
jgi:hypothetical protein